MQVVDANSVVHSLMTNFVGCTVGHASADAVTCQPASDGVRIVVATRFAHFLCHRGRGHMAEALVGSGIKRKKLKARFLTDGLAKKRPTNAAPNIPATWRTNSAVCLRLFEGSSGESIRMDGSMRT